VKQETLAKPEGVWAWILQRVTAVLVLLLLSSHLAVLHYIPRNLTITFAGVAQRMADVLYFITDSGLLIIALYHGLNGVRAILFDYVTGESARRSITYVLLVVGVAFLLWGEYALTAFTK
jgi:succinate dehydrogenase / fumarate reductase, membrane anchor subunit